MKSTQRRRQGKGAFDLIEEATQVCAPHRRHARSLLPWRHPLYTGFLYFWADMSCSPFAPQHLASAALGLTVLFIWMKFWQVVFAALCARI